MVLVGSADVRPDAFALGVLRRDGIVVPFAAFDGKRWSNRWPGPTTSDLQVPVNVASVPKRWWGPLGAIGEWQVWTGAAPGTVRVLQPDWVAVHCTRQVALKTDYRSAELPPPPTAQPYPKDGLTVWPPRPVERILILPASDPAVAELEDVVRSAFNRSERDTADRFRHPVRERTRETTAPTIEAVYAWGAPPRLFYVEAARSYRSDSNRADSCVVGFGTGWFLRTETSGIRVADMAVDLLPCDRYGATYMLPLGVIRAADRTFWIAQYSGWDHERFVVVEIKKDKVEAVVSTWGGAC
jgi:hypothetical protein